MNLRLLTIGFLALVVSSTVVLSGCKKDAPAPAPVEEPAVEEPAVEEPAEGAMEGAHEALDHAEEAVEQATEEAHEAVDGAKEAVHEATAPEGEHAAEEAHH